MTSLRMLLAALTGATVVGCAATNESWPEAVVLKLVNC